MESDDFVALAALICEPVRARMLWKLLDGKAYTATELALHADVSTTSASNHLSKLLGGNLLKVEVQGRHRYYGFANGDVAHTVEALANLSGAPVQGPDRGRPRKAVEHCRSCYDHLAGEIGVALTESLVDKGILESTPQAYRPTEIGWQWFLQWGVSRKALEKNRRPMARKCLDWSERRPHLAGQLGAALLQIALREDWVRRVAHSRALVVTAKGSRELHRNLGISL